MNAKWKPAVLAIAWRWSFGDRSLSFLGIAGNCPFSKPGTAGGNVSPKSGFFVRLILRPITGVYGKLHEVSEPSDVLGTGSFTARQGAKLIQIDWIRPPGNQVRIDEGEVSEFIFGIIVNILGHVPIQHFKSLDVGRTSTPSGDFAVLDSSQLVVLLPSIGFEYFGCRQE